MEKQRKSFIFATDSNLYPCSNLEMCIHEAGMSGNSGTIYEISGCMGQRYDYVCDIMVDKDVKKKIYSIEPIKGGVA